MVKEAGRISCCTEWGGGLRADNYWDPSTAGFLAKHGTMRAKHPKMISDWCGLSNGKGECVIVLPSPHGQYKSGISYSDAVAAGEIYASVREFGQFDVRAPELLGNDIDKNLILIGGKKANAVSKNFQNAKYSSLTFDLDDGVIFDKEKQVVLTPEYVAGQERTLSNVIADYGLIVYADNPQGKSTKILQLAGIKGYGTLAAALSVVDREFIRNVEKSLVSLTHKADPLRQNHQTVEILVKIPVINHRANRGGVQIEKIVVNHGRVRKKWESDQYHHLKAVGPRRLYVNVTGVPVKPIHIKVRVGDQEVAVGQSPDRQNAIYLLAKQAKEDYLKQAENKGWLHGSVLAERLWGVKHRNGVTELPEEMKKQISDIIKRWANHLERRGDLTISDKIKLDSRYINSEILVLDSDIRKKVVDLVHMINHEEKNGSGPSVPLIESKPRLGYRINIHPALIFIND